MPFNYLPCSAFRRSGTTSGQLVVGAIVLIAAILAAITVWHHWSKGQASIAYWGPTNGENIRYAPTVRFHRDGKTVDISKAPGLVHFRQALIEDASFEERSSKGATLPDWQVEVVFSWPSRQEETTVLFDLDQGLVGLESKEDMLVAKQDPTLSGLRTFFADLSAKLND